MLTPELLDQLKAPFAANEHKPRKLPGGGRWLYVPWQSIRERIQEIDPNFEVSYTDPVVAAGLVVIRCQLTICGVCREGVGNHKEVIALNSQGKEKIIGDQISNATAAAFKHAAENFGVCTYLDDQKFVAKLLNSQGDGRGFQYAVRDKKQLSNGNGNGRTFDPPRQKAANPDNNNYARYCKLCEDLEIQNRQQKGAYYRLALKKVGLPEDTQSSQLSEEVLQKIFLFTMIDWSITAGGYNSEKIANKELSLFPKTGGWETLTEEWRDRVHASRDATTTESEGDSFEESMKDFPEFLQNTQKNANKASSSGDSFPDLPAPSDTLTREQQEQLWNTARDIGGWENEAFKAFLIDKNYQSTAEIPQHALAGLFDAARSSDTAAQWNQGVQQQAVAAG